jgi:hypothetical protein
MHSKKERTMLLCLCACAIGLILIAFYPNFHEQHILAPHICIARSTPVRNFVDPSCRRAWECRPRMLGVVFSNNVQLNDFHIVDPIYWTIHIIGSKRVWMKHFSVHGDWQIFNNDGIDVDSSSDVELTACDINTADDAVCIKTTLEGVPLQRVKVHDCRLRSRASAVKLGSESSANMSDMVFEDLTVHDSHRGLAIQLRDAGNVTDVLFRNVSISKLKYDEMSWWGAAEVAYVTATPRFAGRVVGTVTNVTYEHISAVSENGIFISGAPDQRVHGVTMRDMNIVLKQATQYPGGFQDMRPGPLDVSHSGGTAAVWVEHASEVHLEDVHVIYTEPARRDWRQHVHVDRETTQNFECKRCTFANATATGAIMDAGTLVDKQSGVAVS